MNTIDTAQRRQQEEIDHALASRTAPAAGRTHCANLDCEAPILPLRQQMGAQLCIDCQRASELRAQSCARRGI